MPIKTSILMITVALILGSFSQAFAQAAPTTAVAPAVPSPVAPVAAEPAQPAPATETPAIQAKAVASAPVPPVAAPAPVAARGPGAPPASPAPSASADDPNIDRAFLLPTAMTQPAGSITYNNYELLLHGVTYGVTDNVQATVTVLAPIVKDMPLVVFGDVKGRIVHTDRVSLALQASAAFGQEMGSSAINSSAYSLGAGALTSLCLNDDCSSLLSGSLTYQIVSSSGSNNTSHFILYGGSLIQRISAHVKLLGEVTSAASGNDSNDISNSSVVLLSYGVRFYAGSIAGDIGFIKPISDNYDGGILLGLPFVNVSYRWN